MIIWKHKDRQCAIIEFSCPAYLNIEKKIKEKIDWNTNQKFTNGELELRSQISSYRNWRNGICT